MTTKTVVAVLAVLLRHGSAAAATRRVKLLPAARTEAYTPGAKVLGVIRAGTASSDGLRLLHEGPPDCSRVIDAAFARFLRTLDLLPDFPCDYEDPTRRPDFSSTLQPLRTVHVQVLSEDATLNERTDESYSLSVAANSSRIDIRSQSVFGAVRALESVSQLVEFGWMASAEASRATPVFVVRDLPLSVTDAPSYPYRGLMIDTSRHFLPQRLILDNLDAMAMNKLNVLHWHLTDTQSWPFQSASFPNVSRQGAYHPSMVYTPDDIRTVVHEAYLRGIRVVPEIDMPGHIQSLSKSHPELLSPCPDPREPLDPTNPDVYEFVDSLYRDLSALFPDPFVHVGGDEVDLSC